MWGWARLGCGAGRVVWAFRMCFGAAYGGGLEVGKGDVLVVRSVFVLHSDEGRLDNQEGK